MINDLIVLTVCAELDSMISAGTPPDLVLDLTVAGETSEVMKKISLDLGLPTVTSASGEEREIWSWSSLTPDQEGYLVQVRSPADILPGIITDLANMTNMNTAAVLYDNSFSKLRSGRIVASLLILIFSRNEETSQKSVQQPSSQTRVHWSWGQHEQHWRYFEGSHQHWKNFEFLHFSRVKLTIIQKFPESEIGLGYF